MPTGVIPQAIAVADVDDNGTFDLITANTTPSGGSLAVFYQSLAGVFAAPVSIATAAALPRSVAAADYDGDGWIDLAVADGATNAVWLLRQSGTAPGTFSPWLPLLATGADPRSLVALDLDGDGDVDLATANRVANNVTVFLQSGGGAFSPAPAAVLACGAGPESLAAADLDADGDLDLVTANRIGGDLSVLYQLDGVSYALASPLSLDIEDVPTQVHPLDLEGDGDCDLVVACEAGRCVVLTQLDRAVFATTASDTLPCGASPTSVAAADLDGDGDQDLLATSTGSDRVTPFIQFAPGRFAPGGALQTGGQPRALAVADVDRDGDVDLVVANFADNTVAVLPQVAPGQFGAPSALLTTGPGPQSVVVGDFNTDGRPDIAAAVVNAVPESIVVFLQLASGGFATTASAVLATGADPKALVAADLNHDGRVDLACANTTGANVTIYYQGASGLPSAASTTLLLTVGTRPSSLVAEDLNGDGRLDLVVASLGPVTTTNTGTLDVYLQTAAGAFPAAPSNSLIAGTNTAAVVATDLDGDGDADLVGLNAGVSTNPSTGNLTTFRQVVPGVFVKSVVQQAVGVSSTLLAANALLAADLDGDGEADLACVNTSTGNLAIYTGSF